MSSNDQTRLHVAADKLEITEVIYTYADCTDRGDFEALFDCFHPDAMFQFQEEGIPLPVRDFFSAQSDAGAGFKETMHHLSNTIIRLDGENAKTQSYVLAHHVMKSDCPDYPPLFPNLGKEYAVFIGGRYVDEFERRNGEWKIALRKLCFEWSAMADDSLVSGPLANMRGNMPSEFSR